METILKQEFEQIKRELIDKHEELGMRASGKWASGLEVQSKDKRVTLWGEPYTYQLQHGRKPGEMPPIKAIEEWIQNKGIMEVKKGLKVSSLAYVIARKIAKEGTKYYKQGGTDLIDSVVTAERIQEILDKVGGVYATRIASAILEEIKLIQKVTI